MNELKAERLANQIVALILAVAMAAVAAMFGGDINTRILVASITYWAVVFDLKGQKNND